MNWVAVLGNVPQLEPRWHRKLGAIGMCEVEEEDIVILYDPHEYSVDTGECLCLVSRDVSLWWIWQLAWNLKDADCSP